MIVNNGKSLQFKREFRVPVQTVFKAWSDPQVFKTWWKGTSVAEIDFRVGGKYLIRWASLPDDYARGIYKEINPDQKIVMTWDTSEGCGGKNANIVTDSLLTLSFRSLGASSCEFELRHDLLPSDRIDDHHFGWTSALLDMDTAFNGTSRKIDPALQVNVSRVLPFPVSKVYAAWTNPEMINRWFNSTGHTLGKASTEMKVGTIMSMDYQMKTGEIFRHHCEYKEIIPNEKLVFTWNGDNYETVSWHRQNESLVTVTFKDLGGKTEISIRHSQLSSDLEMSEYSGGWAACLTSLENEIAKN